MNYASNGKANAALTTGIIGTALGAINTLGANGGLNGVLGGLVGNPAGAAAAATTAGITDNALGMLAGAAIAQGFPRNNCACINEDHTVNRYEMNTQFGYNATIQQKDLELARKANDNLLVTYVNATFYPNQIASLTVDTTKAATSAHTYNPLPACTCNC